MSDATEETARRIAERGREALVVRLRPAFKEAAASHADVLQLNSEQLEGLVQRAADRADGLQWRRALAAVASEELGIGLGEALRHPAVERAQEIVGAPSYEESVTKLGPLPEEDNLPGGEERRGDQEHPQAEERHQDQEHPHAEEHHQAEEHDQAEAVEADEAQDSPVEDDDTRAENPSPPESNGTAPAPDEPDSLRLAAVHLGGIANLAPAESDIQLEFSAQGLDVIRGSNTILGRLGWEDIRSLEVPDPRGWRRRREQGGHLVVRTDHGDASFEIPGLSSMDLRDHLEPIRKYMPT